MKRVFVLIGNICSGKTTFSKLLEEEGFFFYPIEELKKELDLEGLDKEEAHKILYEKYAEKIIELGSKKKIIVESTGGSKFWPACYEKIKTHFKDSLVCVKINAPKEVCLERFKINKFGHRKNTREELIERIDKTLSEGKIPFDFEINNSGSQTAFLEKSAAVILKILTQN